FSVCAGGFRTDAYADSPEVAADHSGQHLVVAADQADADAAVRRHAVGLQDDAAAGRLDAVSGVVEDVVPAVDRAQEHAHPGAGLEQRDAIAAIAGSGEAAAARGRCANHVAADDVVRSQPHQQAVAAVGRDDV